MKDMSSGMGTERGLERCKGESRQDNIHMDLGNLHISNNNEGEIGRLNFETCVFPYVLCMTFET